MAKSIRDEIKELNIGRKIKELRLRKGLTLQNISDVTGLSTPLLSQVENEVVVPPIATLLKISRALGVSISYFFKEDGPIKKVAIVRSHERRKVAGRPGRATAGKMPYIYEMLAYPLADKKMEPFLVEFECLEREETAVLNHKGEEFGFVLEGKLELRINDEIYELEEGDAYYFDSSYPHAIRSIGGKKAKTITVVYGPE